MSEILDTKMKEKRLVNKSNISNPLKDFDLNTKLTTSAKKGLKAKKRSYRQTSSVLIELFSWQQLFGNVGFQNIFIYQPAFSTLDFKENKRSKYVTACKLKGIFKTEL